MVPRVVTVTFVGALVIGAYVGCGSESDGYLGARGEYSNGGTPAKGGTSSGGTASGSGGTASSSGATASSSGASSGGSSGGSAEAGATIDAGAPPMSLDQAFAAFAACMSYADFTSTTANGVAAADIAKAQTTQYGDCNACHNAGDGGFWASYGTVQGQDMKEMMFQQTGVFPYIAKWVTGTVDASGQFKSLAPSNAIADQATLASQCTQGTPCHPKFQLNPALVQAISDFVTITITKMQTGTCSPGDGGLPADAGGGG